MFHTSNRTIRTLIVFLLCQVPTLVLALDTTVILTADNTITPKANEVVTFGLPLAAGDVIKSNEIRVQIGTVEQRVSVKDGLRWHWLDNSLRSVTIQLQGVNMSAGNVTLTITDAGRDTSKDLVPVAQSTGWTSAGPTKANLLFPRIFAVHDLAYLASTGITPPYSPGSTTEGGGKLQSDQFDNNYGAMDYSTASASSWLFDRATAMLKAYMNTGDVKFLKEGFLSKQFYYNHVRNDGVAPIGVGGTGCWQFGAVICADGKYIYTQPAKLAWALFGDNSQWDNTLIVNMALQADLGWNQPVTRSLYSDQLKAFTERGAGIVGLAEVGAYEITGDATVLSHMKERIAALKDMQQTPKAWDITYGWTPMSGAFTHSWQYHEGAEYVPPPGDTDDRRFSPWMSENIADFLWQAYQITSDTTLRSSLGEMMRQLGNAIDKYGFTSSYAAGEGVNATYTRKTGIPATDIACPAPSNEPDNLAIELMYSGSAYASNAALAATHADNASFVDTHNVEVILPLALAFHFETDPVARKRLLARAEHLRQQWTSNKSRNCASIFDPVAYRVFNWQHRSNSVQTWAWALKVEGLTAPLPPAALKLKFPGYVWVSVGACADGNNWHWQCSGKWVPGTTYASYDLIAACVTTDGVSCDNVGVNRRWSFTSDLKLTSNVLSCLTTPLDISVMSSCSSVKYVQNDDSGLPIVTVPPLTSPPVTTPPVTTPPLTTPPVTTPSTPAVSLSIPGYVWVSVGACAAGQSWHWQCAGKWVLGSTYASYEMIATCDTTDGLACDNVGANRRWSLTSALMTTSNVMSCTTPPDMAQLYCPSVKYIQNKVSTDTPVVPPPSTLPVVSAPTTIPGYVWVSVGACAAGQSWHWQCSGKWVLGSTYASYALIATCDTTDGVACDNVGANRRWSLTSGLKTTDNVMSCVLPPDMSQLYCPSVKYIQNTGSSGAPAVTPAPVTPGTKTPITIPPSTLPAASTQLTIPGYVWVSVGACTAGQSWHWQCSGKWVLGSTYASYEMIATCDTTDGLACDNVGVNRRWSLTSALKAADNVMSCVLPPDMSQLYCPSVKYSKAITSAGSVSAISDPNVKATDNNTPQGATTNKSPADQGAFSAGLQQLSADATPQQDGHLLVQVKGGAFSVQEGPLLNAAAVQLPAGNESVRFNIEGSLAKPAEHLIVATYPDGRTQKILPVLHYMKAFDAWMQSKGIAYRFDALTGQLNVLDSNNKVIWRGIPDYSITPSDVAVIDLGTMLVMDTDVNKDGVKDVIFRSGSWTQVIFNIGL